MREVALLVVLTALRTPNFAAYVACKMWKAMVRAGEDVGRNQVTRLMCHADRRGVRRMNRVRTTRPDARAPRSRRRRCAFFSRNVPQRYNRIIATISSPTTTRPRRDVGGSQVHPPREGIELALDLDRGAEALVDLGDGEGSVDIVLSPEAPPCRAGIERAELHRRQTPTRTQQRPVEFSRRGVGRDEKQRVVRGPDHPVCDVEQARDAHRAGPLALHDLVGVLDHDDPARLAGPRAAHPQHVHRVLEEDLGVEHHGALGPLLPRRQQCAHRPGLARARRTVQYDDAPAGAANVGPAQADQLAHRLTRARRVVVGHLAPGDVAVSARRRVLLRAHADVGDVDGNGARVELRGEQLADLGCPLEARGPDVEDRVTGAGVYETPPVGAAHEHVEDVVVVRGGHHAQALVAR